MILFISQGLLFFRNIGSLLFRSGNLSFPQKVTILKDLSQNAEDDMKKYVYLSILALCILGLQVNPVNASTTVSGSDQYVACESLETDIDEETLNIVLTQAAPLFGFTPDQFIRMYNRCNCITVESIGENTYRVEYGGLGIEILVDVSSIIEVNMVLESFEPKFFIKE